MIIVWYSMIWSIIFFSLFKINFKDSEMREIKSHFYKKSFFSSDV